MRCYLLTQCCWRKLVISQFVKGHLMCSAERMWDDHSLHLVDFITPHPRGFISSATRTRGETSSKPWPVPRIPATYYWYYVCIWCVSRWLITARVYGNREGQSQRERCASSRIWGEDSDEENALSMVFCQSYESLVCLHNPQNAIGLFVFGQLYLSENVC